MSESLADVVHEAVERAKADERKPMTLPEFLLARIAEDEEAAKDEAVREQRYPVPAGAAYAFTLTDTFTAARVLAECEAKRRIVRLHHDNNEDDDGWPDGCATCGMVGEYTVPWPCETVRALAQPHAEHPDFDPSWRL